MKRRSCRVFVATLGFFLLTHGGHFYSVDNFTVYSTARSLVTVGSLAIRPGMNTARGRDGRNYSFYPIGLSLLEAPFIWVGSREDQTFPASFAMIVGPNVSLFYPENFSSFGATLLGPLLAALAAAEFWIIAELLGYPVDVVLWLTVILVTATQFWPAARDGFPHIAVASFLLLAVRHAMTSRDVRFIPAPIMIGCAAGMIVLIRPFDAALILPPLAIYLVWLDWQRVWRDRRFLNSNFGRFLIPVVISIAGIDLQNTVQFGSPIAFPEAILGFHTPFLTGLRGLLVSAGRGVIFFSPPVVATIPGLIRLWRRRPAETLFFTALIASFPLGYATYSNWDGAVCWGPRFLVPLIPFVLPLGELLVRRGVGAVIVLMLALAGLLVQIAGTLVDFQRVIINGGAWLVPESPIMFHWRALLAGKDLDWLPVRLYAAHGLAAAIAYAALPLAMMIWATASLRKLIRSADGAGFVNG